MRETGKVLAFVTLFAVLILAALTGHAQQPAAAPLNGLPPAQHFVFYPQAGAAPVVYHIHGVSGEVHVWIMSATQAGAKVEPAVPNPNLTPSELAEQKKLDAIKKLLSQQEKKP